MNDETTQLKRTLRHQLRNQLRHMPEPEREAGSAAICARLKEQEIFRNAKAILFFAPLPDEPDVFPLANEALAAGKVVALPRYVPDQKHYIACQVHEIEHDLMPGQFGIWEPQDYCSPFPLNRLDLALIPGLGFTLSGWRLGRGRGFYDRLLAEVSVVKCGVAFDGQIVDALPSEPHDVRLNCILTPTRWHSL